MEADIHKYINDSLNNYGPPDIHQDLESFFIQLSTDFEHIGNLYQESHALSMQIYNALLNADNDTVTKIGEMLQQKEDEISASGDNEHLAPLIQYINFRLDSMAEQTMTTLAIKTALSYREANQLASELKSGSERLSKAMAYS